MRRRYLSTEAGSDKRLCSVSDTATVCYLLSIPHGDCCGRLPGGAFEYRCRVVPGRPYTDEQVEAALQELVVIGLYVAYDADRQHILSFPAYAWLENQGKALNQVSRPEHPEPPEGIEGLLRKGYSPEAERQKYKVYIPPRRKNAEERGRTRKKAEPRPPTPPEDTGDAANDVPSRPSWPAEREALQAIKGYPFDEKKDAELLASLAKTYPQLDLAHQINRMGTWCAANGKLPLTGQVGPRRRVSSWMAKADEYGARRAAKERAQEMEL